MNINNSSRSIFFGDIMHTKHCQKIPWTHAHYEKKCVPEIWTDAQGAMLVLQRVRNRLGQGYWLAGRTLEDALGRVDEVEAVLRDACEKELGDMSLEGFDAKQGLEEIQKEHEQRSAEKRGGEWSVEQLSEDDDEETDVHVSTCSTFGAEKVCMRKQVLLEWASRQVQSTRKHMPHVVGKNRDQGMPHTTANPKPTHAGSARAKDFRKPLLSREAHKHQAGHKDARRDAQKGSKPSAAAGPVTPSRCRHESELNNESACFQNAEVDKSLGILLSRLADKRVKTRTTVLPRDFVRIGVEGLKGRNIVRFHVHKGKVLVRLR